MNRPLITTPVETFPLCHIEKACDSPPTVRPGVEAFARFVIENLGGTDLGFVRECGSRPSGHYTGSAWDWGMNANDPKDAAKVQELIDWLFANDYELYKRAGICYLIWNRQRVPNYKATIDSPERMNWVPYTGPSPHTDHVHFSFSDAGAMGQTSLYTWLNGGRPMVIPTTEEKLRLGYLFTGFTAGFLVYSYRKDILSAFKRFA